MFFTKELCVTNSFDNFCKVRDRLSSLGIKFTSRIVDQTRQNADRRARGSFGINTEISTMYYVYVNRKDFERANAYNM